MSLGAAVLELAERESAGTITPAEFDAALELIAAEAAKGAPLGAPLAPPNGARSLTAISRKSYARGHDAEGGAMAKDDDEDDSFVDETGTGSTDAPEPDNDAPVPAKEAPAAPPRDTHGSLALKALHKDLHGCRKRLGKSMEMLDDGDLKSHLAEHHGGMEKALKALSKHHGKSFKGHDPLPDDYPDDEPAALDDAPPLDAPPGDGGPDADFLGGEPSADGPLGVRPPDEAEHDGEDLTDEEAELLEKSLPALERAAGIRR